MSMDVMQSNRTPVNNENISILSERDVQKCTEPDNLASNAIVHG